jgi:hypothetical protein
MSDAVASSRDAPENLPQATRECRHIAWSLPDDLAPRKAHRDPAPDGVE